MSPLTEHIWSKEINMVYSIKYSESVTHMPEQLDFLHDGIVERRYDGRR